MRSHLFCAVILILFAPCTCWAAFSLDVGWDVEGAGGFSAANALCDPENGEVVALVTVEMNTGIVCFDLSGKRLWEYPLETPATASPAVADIDGDGREDIAAADGKGNIVAVTGGGALMWSARVPAGVDAHSCPAIVDLDGAGSACVLAGDTSGTLSCFDHKGRLRWQFTGDGTQMGPILAADIYDTPGKEVIVTSHDRHVYALSARGEWLWDLYFEKDLFPNSTPILADVDGDSVPELYVGGGLNHFYRIDLADHTLAFEKNTYMHVNTAIIASDLDGDGKDEVLFGMKGGALSCYGEGGMQWTQEFPKSGFHGAPTIVNLDDDPGMEIICLSSTRDVQVLDADGTPLSSGQIGYTSLVQPLSGDLDNDGMLEMVVTEEGGYRGVGKLVWFELGAPYQADIRNRVAFAGDRAHSGRPPSARQFPLLPAPHVTPGLTGASLACPADFQLLSGSNTWRFGVDNPESQRLALMAAVTYPDKSVRRWTRHVYGPSASISLPFAVSERGTYGLAASLVDADALRTTPAVESSAKFKGLKSDRAYLQGLFDTVDAILATWHETNARSAAYFRGELTALRGMLAELGHAGAAAPGMLASLRLSAERLRTLAVAGAELAPSGSFVAWECCPWAYFDTRDTLPTPDDKTEQLAAYLCQGEYESLALNVTNVSGRGLDVRVRCDDTEHMALRRAVTVPTRRRKHVSDALPQLDEAGLITIPALETQQVWITVNAKGLTPGEHTINLHLKSIEADSTEVELPVVLTVHDLALPRPRPLRFCTWALSVGDLNINEDYVLEDLVEHGNTVFLAESPDATCDDKGKLVTMDFTKHDASIRRFAPHGFVLFMGGHRGLKGQPTLSEPWRKAFVPYMRAWARHLQDLGLGYSQWAMYPIDEPSSPFAEHTIELVEIAGLIREADPNILIYTDPTNGTTEESLDMYKHLVDIWCPSNQLLDRFGEEFLPVAREWGKEVWNYDARGRAKTLSTLGHYRWWLWNIWNLGFQGAGWFCYSHHGKTDRWDGPNEIDAFFAVYDGPGAVVTSKRWEVTREGIEDYEYLYMLREAVRSAQERGVPEAELAGPRALLREMPVGMEATLRSTQERLPLNTDGVPLYEEATRRLDDARQRIVAACIKLRDL